MTKQWGIAKGSSSSAVVGTCYSSAVWMLAVDRLAYKTAPIQISPWIRGVSNDQAMLSFVFLFPNCVKNPLPIIIQSIQRLGITNSSLA